MDTEVLPEELAKAADKFDLAEARTINNMGHGDTTVALGITKKYVRVLRDHLKSKLEAPLPRSDRSNDLTIGFARLVKGLSPEVISLCCLQTLIHSVGKNETLRDTLMLLGLNISGECFAAKLTVDQPRLAARIDKAVRERSGRLEQRQRSAVTMAAAAGFKQRVWSKANTVRAGEWMLNAVLEAMPEVFERVLEDGEYRIVLTEGALALADSIIHDTIMRNPVYLPTALPPKPWVGWNDGGVRDDRLNHVTFLRSPYKDTAAAVKHAIKSGQMQPALDGVNALQNVAWTVNTQVLDVLEACWDRGIAVKGLPPAEPLKKPRKPINWHSLGQPEQALWRHRRDAVAQLNRTHACDALMLTLDITTARSMRPNDCFYTAMNCDWRTRVYALPYFNFQRDDRVRALFLFAKGAPIGEEGLRWLKIHTANCGDFDKVSKRPMEERVRWVDENMSMIRSIAATPLTHHQWWSKADKPFLFLAACVELSAAIAAGPSYVTRLPVSFDGSCSGLQHLCAMTRASEGARVNLTPAPEPQDVYMDVADIVIARIREDDSEVSQLTLAYMLANNARGVVKRNVMTYSYSSKTFGMAQQQDEDLIVPLQLEVTSGNLEEHPFAHYASKKHADSPSAAGRFLAKHVFKAIEEVVEKPALAMKFLQGLARTMAHESKPLTWTTPTGVPWINRYHESIVTRVRLWLHDKGVRLSADMVIAEGHKSEIDKDKAANGVAPNFVHALDASHLLLVARACAAEGITEIATVHDSFGCLATHATRFNQIIREQFVQMYQEHDVLAEVLASATHDLTQANWNKLPIPPERGPLDITEVLNADFAFA